MKTPYIYENIIDFVAATAIGIIATIIFLHSCSCSPVFVSHDNGFVMEGNLVVHQDDYPVLIECETEYLCEDVSLAIEWWRSELIGFWNESDSMPIFAEVVDENGTIFVSEHPTKIGTAGTAYVIFSLLDGDIITVDVHLDPDFWNNWILYHELGHAIFGLADDDFRSDLNSIMSSPIIEWSHVTEGDAYRIFRYFP
jgi:hypothetical protein